MRRRIIVIALLACALPVAAQADTAKLLAEAKSKTDGAMVVVRFKIVRVGGESAGATDEAKDQTVMGQGICVDAAKGLIMTTALDRRMRIEALKDFELVMPGPEGKVIKAELEGIDAVTGLGFVRATEPHTWMAITFAGKSGLTPGQQVVSVGVLEADASRSVYLGVAYVSAMLRVPGRLVYVTGGKLTDSCSPVFNAAGEAIGIVGQQLFLTSRMATRRGVVRIPLQGQQETSFFTPVEEFASALKDHPTGGKIGRLSWIGVNKFEAIPKGFAEVLKLKRPAVQVDEVIPGGPADKAGMKTGDIIVATEGKDLEKMATPDLVVRNFISKLFRLKAGQKIALTFLRGTDEKTVTVTAEPMPTMPNEAERYFSARLGLIVRNKVMLDMADPTPQAYVSGVIVYGLVRRGASQTAGLQNGDLITDVVDRPVKTVKEFGKAVEAVLVNNPNAPVKFVVHRGRQVVAVNVQPPIPQPPAP